jgi:hypothetical protein
VNKIRVSSRRPNRLTFYARHERLRVLKRGVDGQLLSRAAVASSPLLNKIKLRYYSNFHFHHRVKINSKKLFENI